jgi:long-chain-fatty-acid--[acyl-carrier-protein] ligase
VRVGLRNKNEIMKKHAPVTILLGKLLFALGRAVLWLRYRVTLNGTHLINQKTPHLFLPNHQAIVDPMLFMSHIYRFTTCVPIVTSGYYDMPVVNWFFKQWGAVRVSDLQSGSRNTRVLDDISISVRKGFGMGKNIVLYPAGQIAGQGYERIFNKQGAKAVVETLPPHVKIIGVRIHGLWGSMWSKAWTGRSPRFIQTLLKGFFYTLANLLFFLPRREVNIEFVDITEECKSAAQADRQAFNRYLEDFYNIHGEEAPRFLKHYFYGMTLKRELPTVIQGSLKEMKQVNQMSNKVKFPDALITRVKHIVADVLELPADKINLEDHLSLHLGADSLNLVEMVSEIENQFKDFTVPEMNTIKTVEDLCRVANGEYLAEKELKPSYLSKDLSRIERIAVHPDKNILWQFLDTFTQNKSDWFSYDTLLGSTNRKHFLLKAIVVSHIIRKEVKDHRVGILLPAMQSTTLLVIATYLAGKVPVMLNWTVGKKVLEHCLKTADVSKVLSAGAFVEKIEEQLPESLMERLVLLEQKVAQLSAFTKLKGLLQSLAPKRFFHYKSIDPLAVILFTSGSEDLPKAVPLTHSNLVNNLHSVFEMIPIDNNLIFLGILPPFHSFGFTVLTILPLVSGNKVAYSPNPTDGNEVLTMIKHVGCEVLIGTPGFLKLMMAPATPYHFKSVKYAISGAEALTPALKEQFLKLVSNGLLLEGYGITECAPVLSLNPKEKQKLNSVGKFLPGIEYLIVHPENYQPLSSGEEGMILVRGKNVFSGYLDQHLESPFVMVQDKQYYKTGDLGYVDADGFVFITGRLKRFVKTAGEMISLPFLERVLNAQYGREDEIVLAVEGSDKVTPTQITLFTCIDIDRQEAQGCLKKNGVAAIAKITNVVKLREIPLLGSGKINYRLLKEQVEAGMV